MLHMLCGKMAAGKSTLATELAQSPDTVRLSEDDWLAALFRGQMSSGADYIHYSEKLRRVIGPHVAALLHAGTSVVLDFAANTPEQRAWMRALLDETGAAHEMHVLMPPDAVCLARLHARNAAGSHPFAPTDAQFHAFSRFFSPPAPEEGFNCVYYD